MEPRCKQTSADAVALELAEVAAKDLSLDPVKQDQHTVAEGHLHNRNNTTVLTQSPDSGLAADSKAHAYSQAQSQVTCLSLLAVSLLCSSGASVCLRFHADA
jgi:hypothetical protein